MPLLKAPSRMVLPSACAPCLWTAICEVVTVSISLRIEVLILIVHHLACMHLHNWCLTH